MARINLRREAKGRDCQVRAPGCNFDPATTVLAHWNGAGLALKRDDVLGAWACFDCHNFVDGRGDPLASISARQLYLALGILRTLEILRREGKIQIAGE